jgi:kynureninase
MQTPYDHNNDMQFTNTQPFAATLDASDPLREFRNEFIIPEANGKQQVYFLGNSLGLQPKSAAGYIQSILDDWASLGVESFFHAKEPWMDYHNKLVGTLSKIVGAQPNEVVVMNQLTVNLHLMLASFYRPSGKRNRIICEGKAFPSDQYALETHVKERGLNPAEVIIEVSPRANEHTLRTEDILAIIEKYKDETALVLFGGINYYTGQLLDMAVIASAARKAGTMVGFDLAHAAGNVPLHLHDWEVDFACWCSYKYLNSGPGAIGGVFIHERNHEKELPRLAGWWGYDKASRFRMQKGFVAMAGAEGWQLSTPALLLYAMHRAALEIVENAGWPAIQTKQRLLNNYCWFVLEELNSSSGKRQIEFITPRSEKERGCQVSMLMLENGRKIYEGLISRGFMVDWREPNVIRLAPVPLYNTFEEVWKFGETLRQLI